MDRSVWWRWGRIRTLIIRRCPKRKHVSNQFIYDKKINFLSICFLQENEAESPEWFPLDQGPFTKADQVFVDLRRLQQKAGCSDATCAKILQMFAKYLHIDASTNLQKSDKKLKKVAGAEMLRLQGCIGCHDHVFHPTDKATDCPKCNHPRLDTKGKAFEVSHVGFI